MNIPMIFILPSIFIFARYLSIIIHDQPILLLKAFSIGAMH